MMGTFSIWHWVIVLLVITLLFGAGRISSVMADVGRGIKSFKKGLADEDEDDLPSTTPRPQQRITDDRPVDTRKPATQPADVDRR